MRACMAADRGIIPTEQHGSKSYKSYKSGATWEHTNNKNIVECVSVLRGAPGIHVRLRGNSAQEPCVECRPTSIGRCRWGTRTTLSSVCPQATQNGNAPNQNKNNALHQHNDSTHEMSRLCRGSCDDRMSGREVCGQSGNSESGRLSAAMTALARALCAQAFVREGYRASPPRCGLPIQRPNSCPQKRASIPARPATFCAGPSVPERGRHYSLCAPTRSKRRSRRHLRPSMPTKPRHLCAAYQPLARQRCQTNSPDTTATRGAVRMERKLIARTIVALVARRCALSPASPQALCAQGRAAARGL